MGPRAGLDGRKISSPPGFDPRPSRINQSLYRLSYRPTHKVTNIKVFTNLRNVYIQMEEAYCSQDGG